MASDPGIAFHRINTPAAFPDAAGVGSCGANRYGDIACGEGLATTDGRITLDDWTVLRNYLRSGSLAGAETAAGVLCNPSYPICADLNQDRLINEADLSVMTKFMRGYIHRLPAHY